jgi:hypothetical protein
MSNLKVGDKVRCIDAGGCPCLEKMKWGYISRIYDAGNMVELKGIGGGWLSRRFRKIPSNKCRSAIT